MNSDISLIEQHKENIVPLPGGRSFSGLVSAFKHSATPAHKSDIERQRQHHESLIADTADLDDPLQHYVDYIAWTHQHYPQGNNAESGLLGLLEKCTSSFRDVAHYKNDPRYLKVWLEYVQYSDSAIDVFSYLAKKEIGRNLASYYEQFAKYLEAHQRYDDARSVYDIGLQLGAYPPARLSRSFSQFQLRVADISVDKSDSSVKNVLSLKRGSSIAPIDTSQTSIKRSKLQVFVDDSSNRSVPDLFTKKSEPKELASIAEARKENRLAARPWSGEILRQSSSLSARPPKLEVYQDPEPQETTQQLLQIEDQKAFTVINRPGKRSERLDINLDLLHPDGDELSLAELLSKCRKMKPAPLPERIPPSVDPSQESVDYIETNDTFTVPLKDETFLGEGPRSPTVTMFSKMANKEVMNMFNSVSRSLQDDIVDDKSEGENSTNYDGFVTETLQGQVSQAKSPELKPITTPPTADASPHSSPFVERPSSMMDQSEGEVLDPTSEELRAKLISTVHPSFKSYPGYHELLSSSKQSIRKFQNITDNNTKLIAKGHIHSILQFNDDCIYSLKSQLGEGGYGFVYLVEDELGHFRALKVESTSSNWEFYILNQVHQRLHNKDISHQIIRPYSLYLYRDESYLILNYLSQGTLLDVVNTYKAKGEAVEEVLCIYFAIELLKIVENLHHVGIIHGDLKADNCMLNFEHCKEWAERYSKSGLDGWARKQLVLIDFGRAIDLTLVPEGTQFKSSWKVDQQDCPQMNNNEPWLYEADYYGVAAILHTLLFGKYIEVTKSPSGKYKLSHTLKRYWQTTIWNRLFDMLINPYFNCDEKFPLIDEMKYQRSQLENWLELNSHKHNLKQIIGSLEYQKRNSKT